MFLFVLKRLATYWKLVALSLFRGFKDKTAPLSARRVLVLVILNTFGFMVFAANWMGLLLDEILFPGFRKVEIKKPLFMIGVPRSGTTFFQRLLSRDEGTFSSFRFWEMLFAPSVTQRKIFALLGRLDHKVGRPFSRLIIRIDKWLFASSKQIHQVGLFEMEEDAGLLIWILSSPFLFFPYPYIDTFKAFLRFDDVAAAQDKKIMMKFYSDCVQRHLYFHGPEKIFLSKNPEFALMARTLSQHFPDAVLISTIRTPYETVPSAFSLVAFLIGKFGGNLLAAAESKEFVFDLLEYMYMNPVDSLKKGELRQVEYIYYQDLVTNPGATIRGLYGKLGLEISPEFKRLLEQKDLAAKSYNSKHHYSLEQFGLSQDEIYSRFQAVFDEFGFERH